MIFSSYQTNIPRQIQLKIPLFSIHPLLLMITIFICFGCQKMDFKQSKNQEDSDVMGNLTNQAISTAMCNMQTKHGLKPVATGSLGPKNVDYLITWYNYYGNVDIEFARILFVDAVRELVDQINSQEDLKPFLHDVPFNRSRTDVCIFFLDSKGHRPKTGFISKVEREAKSIGYNTVDENGNHTIIFRETYIEALANIEKLNQTRRSNKSPLN